MENVKLRAGCACASRRRLLGGLAGLGAGALFPGLAARAATPAGRIDIHHHLFPPAYVAASAQAGLAPPPAAPWSVDRTLAEMEASGVSLAVLSVTAPHVGFLDAARARAVARECNEWSAQLVAPHPGRFGFFAMLPMQDTEGALREIEHAFEVLHADGICLLTSYGDKWLGHADFAPVMAELNRRKSVLYTHPTVANCCRNLLPEVSPSVIEFGTDTTRAITDLVFSGRAAQCPDLQFIFSHGGGTMPFLVERLVKMPVLDPRLAARVPHGVMHELRRFHYDTAWSANPVAMSTLARLVDPAQILFGSDYPYRSGADQWQGLLDSGVFTPTQLAAIGRGNALRLLPTLA